MAAPDGPALTMTDSNEKMRVAVGALGGNPTLDLFNAAGKRLWSAP